MTCKDCLHNEMCYGTHTDDSPTCCDFKDKSLYIELPCKVGDKVYVIDCGYIKETVFEYATIEMGDYVTLYDEYQNELKFEYNTFHSREEAEKALKERN